MKYDLIAEAYVTMLTEATHPQLDERGRPVKIWEPHTPTDADSWKDSSRVATITPGHTVLDSDPKFNESKPDWNDKSLHGNFEEPAVNNRSGKALASGVIIHEDDGRVWAVHPTNQFGGYEATFPKGKVDPGLDMRTNAIKEAWEESGLHVQLTGHAADVERSTSYTRYYHAKRIGGNPKNMGWESQAVSLIPKDQLHRIVNHPNDSALVAAAKSKE
jgi:ADP-ribose pyrophosphatase YjhB (NUDIX family)